MFHQWGLQQLGYHHEMTEKDSVSEMSKCHWLIFQLG